MYYYASKRKPADICHRHFHCDLSLLSQVLKILWSFQNFVTFGNKLENHIWTLIELAGQNFNYEDKDIVCIILRKVEDL